MKQKEAREKFNKILQEIKEIKIQGATNIAKAALKAYSLQPTKKAKEKLINARPTEPLMFKVLDLYNKIPTKKILEHFSEVQEKINKHILRLIKNNAIIYTHCHSNTVTKALIYAKKKGKKFSIYNTETRPLYQGRKTARELAKAKIKVFHLVDSAMSLAIKKADLIFLGADALLKDGIINKVGSNAIAKISFLEKKPLYIIADSWKFADKIKIEERNPAEIWKNPPRGIKIRNPAFEFVPKKYIKKIISELGILDYNKFIKNIS